MSAADGNPKRLRILHVTRNLPPLRGGMERLNLHIALELAREFEVAVIGPSGCRAALPDSIGVIEVPARPLWRFFPAVLLRSIGAAFRFRPDVVLGGSGLVAPFVWIAARICRARAAIYVHGLDLIADYAVYRWFWRPFIRRADLCIANSRHTAQLAIRIGVAAKHVVIVHPGIELPSDTPAPGDFRQRFDLGDRPLLLSVGRLVARKGLLEFVENALPQIAARFPDVCLAVLGDEVPDLLHGSSIGLGERIRQRAAERGVEGNIRFIGPQDDQTLADAYRSADVHVFPVRDVPGDVEGFGMVAVEAAAYGLPTVAFAVGGVPDAVEDGVSGSLVEPGDYRAFAAAVTGVLARRSETGLRGGAVCFAAAFDWSMFGNRIRGQLRGICGVN